MRPLRRVSVQPDSCPYKKKFGHAKKHQGIYTEERPHKDTMKRWPPVS